MPCDIVPPVSLQNIDLLISLPLLFGAMVCMNVRAQCVPMFYFVSRPPTCELKLTVIVIIVPPIEDRRACIAECHSCFASFFCFRSFGAVLSTSGRALGKNEFGRRQELKLLSDFTLKLLDDPWVWSGADNCLATTTINVSWRHLLAAAFALRYYRGVHTSRTCHRCPAPL